MYLKEKQNKTEIIGFIFSLIMINHVILSHHQSTIFMIFLLIFFSGLSMSNKKKEASV